LSDPGSLQAYITSDIKKAQEQEIQKIAVPRFEGRLIVRYKAVDARTLIKIGIDAQGDPDEVNGVITAAVDALLAACEGTETDRGEDLGKVLGAELAGFLGLGEVVSTDSIQGNREGVFLIFDDEFAIVNTSNQLKQFQQLANQKIGEEIVGNSGAVSQ
jgi:hypothetical protein